jgi:chromosome segregation ATPase
MDTNFSIVNSRIHETHREILEVRAQLIQLDEKIIRFDQRINRLDDRINGLDEKINLLRGEFLEFKEEMRLVPVKIAGWVAGAMIGSSGVIFGGFQLLRGLL